MTFRATVLTLYPEMFPGPLGVSLAGRALGEGKWSLDTVQIRDFAIDRHKTVDDTPAGGGAGRHDSLGPVRGLRRAHLRGPRGGGSVDRRHRPVGRRARGADAS